MEILDAFFGAFGSFGSVARDRSPQDQVAAGVMLFALPLVWFCGVLMTPLGAHPTLAMLWLPMLLAGLGYVVCRLFGAGAWYSLAVVLGGGAFTMFAGASAELLRVFAQFM